MSVTSSLSSTKRSHVRNLHLRSLVRILHVVVALSLFTRAAIAQHILLPLPPEDQAWNDISTLITHAEQRDAIAQLVLAIRYYRGVGVERDFARSSKWLREAADHGLGEAQYLLGQFYAAGIGVEADRAEALTWWRKAAKQGIADADFFIGITYLDGQGGVPRDVDKGVAALRSAGADGSVSAQVQLGAIYEEGAVVPRDLDQALKWYVKAAKAGSGHARNQAGYCYEQGKGTKVDNAEALKWFLLSAATGDADGDVNVGRMFAQGKGTTRDFGTARQWYLRGAERGSPRALVLLAQMSADGVGVERDPAEAYKWLALSAELDSPLKAKAMAARDEYQRGIRPSDFVEGQRRAREWLARHAERHADTPSPSAPPRR